MIFTELEVFIDHQPKNAERFRARVMQWSAEGAVFGRDIIPKSVWPRSSDKAMFAVCEKFRKTKAAKKLTFIFDPLLKREPETMRVL